VPEMIEFELPGGRAVTVEVAPAAVAGQPERVGRLGQPVRAAKASFDEALADVRDAASSALAQFRAMPSRPDEVEITFGVKFDAKAGAIIAETGLSAHFQVKVIWARDRRVPGGDEAPGLEEDGTGLGGHPADGEPVAGG
jgi:Trypsin-co-occurring domain 1